MSTGNSVTQQQRHGSEYSVATRTDKHKHSYEPIYEEIRDRICLLEYPPGTLLTENELAMEFGVSRTPVRRALHRLEFEGLVESKRGVGTMVKIVDLRALREVYALRLRLYEFIGDFSTADRITEEDIGVLEAILEKIQAMHGTRNSADNRVALARLYMDFNKIITDAISNDALRHISEQLFYQTSRVWLQILPDLDREDELDYFHDELARVIDVLRTSGDMQAVAAIRREHMFKLLRRIRRYLGELDIAQLES